ncbi:MAG: phosphatidic acid phosphatase [Lachnospiraceae bacterium]|nr:phosphatidic acid phosphatase [Lachnospiraceae bacterium]
MGKERGVVRERLFRIIPKYSVVPIGAMLVLNFVTYFVTRLFTNGRVHHSMALPLDGMIPFVPGFVSVYLLAFAQWVICYILIARENEAFCRYVCRGELIAKACCLVAFVVYPTTILRPEIAGGGIWEQLTGVVYIMDAPNNLFPSIHCLESWTCFRGIMQMKNLPKWVAPVVLIFSLLVFASTVFLKQHMVVDMVGAVIVVELGLWISRKIESRKNG